MKTIVKIMIGVLSWLSFTAMAFAGVSGEPQQPMKLSLVDCLKLGFQNNSKLIAIEHQIVIAEKGVREKYGSYLPTVSYLVERKNTKTTYEPINYTETSDIYTQGISVTQTLYAGGAIKAGYQIALLNLESVLEDKRRTEQELAYNIKTAFYNLWLKQQNYETALVCRENMAKHYQLINRMYQIGSRNKLDLSQARVLWEEQKIAALAAGNQVAGARLTLAALIGVDRFQEFTVDYDLSQFNSDTGMDYAPRTIIAAAYQDRSELRKIKQSIAVAEYRVKQAQAGLLPNVSLSYSYGEGGKEILSNDTRQWDLKVSLSGLIFDGDATRNRIAAAQENLKLVRHQETMLQEQVSVEVIQTIRSLGETRELVKSNRLNIDLAKENVNLTEIQFNNGKATTNDFKSSQLSLIQALDGYYGQVINYLQYQAKYDYVLGKDIHRE